MADVRVEGLPELAAALQRVVDQVADGGAAAVAESARSLKTDIRRRVGVHSGRERAAIEIRPTHGGRGAEVGTAASPGVDYEQYPEFGTSKQPAQPAFQPAAEAETVRFPQRVASHVSRRLG